MTQKYTGSYVLASYSCRITAIIKGADRDCHMSLVVSDLTLSFSHLSTTNLRRNNPQQTILFLSSRSYRSFILNPTSHFHFTHNSLSPSLPLSLPPICIARIHNSRNFPPHFCIKSAIVMAQGGNDSLKSPYEKALDALSSLITRRTRADTSNMGDRFSVLFEYLKMLDLEEPISKMKIIHVAGTKGKGSTCTFTESILRNCGFRTGLFTSPHLIDVRERFRLDGVEICEEKFLAYFWWCYDRLKEKTDENVPMPPYFRFLALLAFKIFAEEQVDVAIMEVGLGGKYDATNVVQKPIVCGITSLGYDHMEILGNTLGEIAGEKAGIFKDWVPAFTVPQPDEAMHVLEEKASQLNVPLRVAQPLDAKLLNGLTLGLEGEHQYLNAGLAVLLCSTWLKRTGHLEYSYLEQTHSLPEQFVKGLTTASLQGRAQIVPDQHINIGSQNELVFFLDGAHSPESLEACARWFSSSVKEDNLDQTLFHQKPDNSKISNELVSLHSGERTKRQSTQILVFNCLAVRDPQLLLPRLMQTCADNGVYFKKALFVPSLSVYYKVGSHSLTPAESNVDLSWQSTLQKVWENLMQGNKGIDAKSTYAVSDELKEGMEMSTSNCEHSAVFPSLPLAIKWLRDRVQQNQSVRFQVLVTGSLHLVGDVLKLVKK